MRTKENLRPVIVNQNGRSCEGYFHRFAFKSSEFESKTQALIELKDGTLRFFDPYYVKFTDR